MGAKKISPGDIVGCAIGALIASAIVVPIVRMGVSNPRVLLYKLGLGQKPPRLDDQAGDKAGLKRLSGKILRRARFKCENCGQKRKLKVYYIVEPHQGGECTYDNLQALCELCHTNNP